MHYLQELPLVFFTILAQLAVGMVLVGQAVIRRAADDATRVRARRQSVPALLLFGVAAIISLAHTGTPLHGPYTLLNIGSSWLSREIAMLAVTGLPLLLLAFLRLGKTPWPIEPVLAALVVVAGVVLIYVMSAVYNRPNMPGWHGPAVFPSFLSSALMLGSLWHAMALSLGGQSLKAGSAAAAKPVIAWSLAGFVLLAACLPLSLPDQGVAVNTASLIAPYSCLAWSRAIQALLSGLAVSLGIVAALRALGGEGFRSTLAVPAFALLLLGELFGRLVFYLSYSRLGM